MTDLTDVTDATDVIPRPRHAVAQDACFDLGPDTRLVADEGAGHTERWLRATLGAATGLPLAPGEGAAVPSGCPSTGHSPTRATASTSHPTAYGSPAAVPPDSSGAPRPCASCSDRTPSGAPRCPAAGGGCRWAASRTRPASAGAD